jgi:hypothetical protein
MATVSVGVPTVLNDPSGVDFVVLAGPAPGGAYTDAIWEIDANVFNSASIAGQTHFGVTFNTQGTGDPAYARRGEQLWQDAHGIIIDKLGQVVEEFWYRDAAGVANAATRVLRKNHNKSRYYRVRLTAMASDGRRFVVVEQRNAGEPWQVLVAEPLMTSVQFFRTSRTCAFLFGESAAAGSVTVTAISMTNGS